MKSNFFRRNPRQAQLQDLYRQAEQGGDRPDVDAELQQAFAEDQLLMQQLDRFASLEAPSNRNIGRAALLAAVARQRSETRQDRRRTLIGQRLGARGFALLAAAGIFAGGAVTVGASGGVGNAAGNANDVLATLHVPHKTHGSGHGNANNGDETETPGASGASATQRAKDNPGAVEGIPTANTQHHAADGDATCEKGETAVKTTPSGVAVTVPCQTAEDHGQNNDSGKSDQTHTPDEASSATETHGHSGEDADHTPVPHPTEANPHSTEGADNSPDQ